MSSSRRDIMKIAGAVGALGVAGAARAQQASAPAAFDFGNPSDFERDLKIVNCEWLEEDAKKILPPWRFAVMGPNGDGWTYRENRRAFGDYPILAHRLQNVDDKAIDLRAQLLEHSLPFPMIVCPMGAQGTFHARAEAASAAGAEAAGTLFVMSGAATLPMEDVAKAHPGPKWFQIYMNADMEINRWLVQRAKAAGFSAIVLTADALGPGQSDEYIRLGRPQPPGAETPGNHDPARGGKGVFRNFKRNIGFDDIGFLREASGLPVVAKGLLRADDAKQAVASGAAAVWISNHGGRQMDGVPASISMLGPAADALGGSVPIILDSGVRRGIDIFKALALGANVVSVGRPVLWGMTAGGSAGVKGVFTQLAAELKAAMLLSGVAKATDIHRDFVRYKPV